MQGRPALPLSLGQTIAVANKVLLLTGKEVKAKTARLTSSPQHH